MTGSPSRDTGRARPLPSRPSDDISSPSISLSEEGLEDPRVIAAVQEYLATIEAGKIPNREQLESRFPEIAETLAGCLDALELVHSVVPKFSQRGEGARSDFSVSDIAHDRTPLGDYQLIRQLGRGGMGVVYEAQQMSLGRRVALKVLPFAAVLDQRQLQRFKNEALAAAGLQHPHIVPVYAVGCERGIHFYVMQLIEGQSLAEAIGRLQDEATGDNPIGTTSESDGACQDGADDDIANQNSDIGTPQSAIDTVVALSTAHSENRSEYYCNVARLGSQAAEALHYAHSRGVIHRDIKPSNLMLDNDGALWVTDFGLATTQADVSLTMTGDLLGTLRYMSPELVAGRAIDQRIDVYGLGVTLYELLTLKPAFDGQVRERLLRQVEETDPLPPRKIEATIPKDLETIVLKAMAKDPAGRYNAADELGADLQRFLEQRPIQARRAGTSQHLWRWAKRNRATASLLVTVCILLAVLAIGGPITAWKQAALAEKEAAARKSADDHRRRLQEILDRMLIGRGVSLGDSLETQQMQHELAEAALGYYQELFQRHGEDPEIRFKTGVAYQRLARIKKFSDQPGESADLCAEAIAILTPLVTEFPADERFRYELCVVLVIYGNLLTYKVRDPEHGIECLQRGLLLAKRLVHEDPNSERYRWQLNGNRHYLAGALFDSGRIAEAEFHRQQEVHAGLRHVEKYGTKENAVFRLAWATSGLAQFYLKTSRFEQAQRELRKAGDLFALWPDAYLTKKPERMAVLAQHRVTSGYLHCATQRPELAEPFFRDAISISEKLLHRFAPYSWGQHIRADAYEGLSDALLAMGRMQDAERAMQEALIERQRLADAGEGIRGVHADLAWSEIRMGQLRWWMGKEEDVGEFFGTARERLEHLLTESPSVRAYQLPLAVLLTNCPDVQFRNPARAIELAQSVLHRQDGSSWQLLGVAYYRAGTFKSAVDALERSVEIWDGRDAFSWAFLAMAHWRLRNEEEARQWFDKFVDAVENSNPVQLDNFIHPLCLHDLRREAETLMEIKTNSALNP